MLKQYISNRKVFPEKFTKRNTFHTTDKEYGPEAADFVPDMAPEIYKKNCDEFLQYLVKADKEANCEATVLQSDSQSWINERRKRLTAPYFGNICKLKKTSTVKTVAYLLYSSFKGNNATLFGLQNEEVAIKEFDNLYDLKVKKCGLVIDTALPFLACSPDGLVGDDAVVEIKSSYKAGDLSPIDACKTKLIDFCQYKENIQTITIKRSHNYFYQIQGVLHITNRKLCYLIVATRGGIFVEKIKRYEYCILV